jgi:hypothetical protein
LQDVEVEVEGENKPVKKRSYTRGKSFSLDRDIGTMHYDGKISVIVSSVEDPDDFWPDPDLTFENVQILTLNKFSTNFLLDIFICDRYALKSIFMNQKVKQQGFLRFLCLLHTPKRLRYAHLVRPGSGS